MTEFIEGHYYVREDLSRVHLCVEDNGSLYLDAIEDGQVTGDVFWIDEDEMEEGWVEYEAVRR